MNVKISKIKKYFQKINSLLLEGGSFINCSFLKDDYIHEITIIQTLLTSETKDMPLFYDPDKSNSYIIKKLEKIEHNG